jgi:hypothetical protein
MEQAEALWGQQSRRSALVWLAGKEWHYVSGETFRFAALGNALTAAAMGALGAYISNSAIFIATAILCIPALMALSQIRPDEIDYARARNATKRDDALDLQRIMDLRKNRNLLIFAGCMVLFQFSNAALLPLVG